MNETEIMIDTLRILSLGIKSKSANAHINNAIEMLGELDSQLESAKNLFAQFYQVLGAHDANENALDAALAASDGNFDFELRPYVAEVDVDGLKEQLAKANERVKELEAHANRIADALGFDGKNNNRFATSVICTNISNLTDFSNCLSRIEDEFLMVESEPDELGDVSQEVAFSKWGLTPIEYCAEFGKWLNKFAIEKKIDLLGVMVSSASNYLFYHDKLDIRANHLDMLLKNFCNYHREQLRKEQSNAE